MISRRYTKSLGTGAASPIEHFPRLQGQPGQTLRLWMNADEMDDFYTDTAGTLHVSADGDLIGYFDNRRAVGSKDLKAVNDSTRPTYKAAIQNSHPVVRNASGKWLDKEANLPSALSQPFTIFVVCDHSAVPAADEVLADVHPNAYPIYADNPASTFSANFGSAVNGPALPGGWAVFEAYINGAASTLRVNGGTASTVNPGTAVMGFISLASISGGASYLAKDMGEAIVLTGTVDTATLRRIRLYLGNKWGISVS